MTVSLFIRLLIQIVPTEIPVLSMLTAAQVPGVSKVLAPLKESALGVANCFALMKLKIYVRFHRCAH